MRTIVTVSACALLFGLSSLPAAAAEEREVVGTVLDAAGEPAADVEVATYWILGEGRWDARQSVRTDAEGKFTLSVRVSSRTRSVMAFDETQEHGAVAHLDEKAVEGPLVLRLAPTSRVFGAFASESLGYAPEKLFLSATARPAGIAVASTMGPPEVSFRLPPGDYLLRVAGVDCVRIHKRVTLTSDMRAVDLGTTDLEATIIARHYGRTPPPLRVTGARGIDEDVRLSDLEGKWVLLEFWGFW